MSGYTHLSTWERDELAALLASGLSQAAIAKALGRSKSTISRELSRNRLPSGAYRPIYADGCYLHRRQRTPVLERDAALRGFVLDRLAEGWTPEQIAGRLRLGFDRLPSISFETIYAWIYAKARAAERLWLLLPRRRSRRRPLKSRHSKDRIADKTHISERSEAANQRTEAGHWESDLIICRKSRPVLVLHERKTRITVLARLTGKSAAETVSVLMAVLKRLAPSMRGSITFDNGGEFARHAMLRGLLSATTYFCDAYASWQKGGVENTNGRLRRWLPRSTDLDAMTDADLQEIGMSLNLTPRKCLAYKTPIEAFLAELGKDLNIRFNGTVALQS